MSRPAVFALIATALAVVATARPAKLDLSFADSTDPHPARVQIAATTLGLGLELLISWSRRAE